jgi:hypothetical protein
MAQHPSIVKARRRASRQLGFLLLRQKHKCFFCRVPLVHIRSIHPDRIVRRTNYMLVFRDAGEIFAVPFATVEHLVPLANGGTNDWNNLVAACSTCNKIRNQGRPICRFVRCPDCGQEKSRASEVCTTCELSGRLIGIRIMDAIRPKNRMPGSAVD